MSGERRWPDGAGNDDGNRVGRSDGELTPTPGLEAAAASSRCCSRILT